MPPYGEFIGHVVEIRRYPVKSMRGERPEKVELRWTGIAGDRQYAFVRSGNRSRFPWLTGRELSELVLYEARYADGGDPRNSSLTVIAPDGRSYDIWDAALATRLETAAREPVHLLRLGRGAFDQHPVSIVSTATHRRIDEAFGSEVDPCRFRVNIVVDAAPGAPGEEKWHGKCLGFGPHENPCALRVDEAIARCAMITIDPATAARDPAIMRMVAQRFDNEVGLYATPVTCGEIAIGDPVYLR